MPTKSENYSRASILRQSLISPEIRKARARAAAKARWSKVSKEDRTAHAYKMIKAKQSNAK